MNNETESSNPMEKETEKVVEKEPLLQMSEEKVRERIDIIFDHDDVVVIASCNPYDGLSEELACWMDKDFTKWLLKKIYPTHKYKDLKCRAVKVEPAEAKAGDVVVMRKDIFGQKRKYVVVDNPHDGKDLHVARGYVDFCPVTELAHCLYMERDGGCVRYEDIKHVLSFYSE